MTSPAAAAIDEVCPLLSEYQQFLSGKAEGTMDAYLRTARQLTGWVARQPGNAGQFQPSQLTKTTVERYLTHLEQEGFSLPHRTRVKSTISNFAQFLIEEKGLLRRNPTRGIELPPVQPSRSEPLSQKQRFIMRSLVQQEGDQRGTALFALGYWAGCRVSEVSWLRMADIHMSPQGGWLHVGEKESKGRDIDLLKQAYQPLYVYLQATCDTARTYVFISQRSERLTEEGIYYWFRTLKMLASENQQDMIADLTFHDLRDDFSYRAREAGWAPEKVADYLGQNIRTGVLALQTPVGSTQTSREQVKSKLKHIEA